MAIRTQITDEREEQRSELARYRADYLAARAPLRASLTAGAIAGFGVFLVPLLVVLGSFIMLRLSYSATVAPAQLIVRTLGLGVYRSDRLPPMPEADTSAPVAVPAPAAVEPRLEGQTDTSWMLAAALVLFWPVAIPLIGAAVAWLFRLRRRRRLDQLRRTPLEFPIFPEVALFYALTAGGGLLVGVGTFVAVGLNLIFAWAGFLIWRWLYDMLLPRFVPAVVRAESAEVVAREEDYRRELRESG